MAATRKRLLVVEDEEALARLLKWHLETVGFDVATVTTGAEALRLAAEQQPDLVILDLRLPDMHGYDVARQLRKLFHPWVVPILMLTGMDQPIDQLRGFAHGADAYLTKPYEPAEVLRIVGLLVGEPAAT
jgi:two-component system phosphate regulon response regulator PhoB